MLSEAERLIVRLSAYIVTLEQSHMELQKQNKELQEKLEKAEAAPITSKKAA